MLTQLLHAFSEHFGGVPAPRVFFAPGRVNLIGEHTDYNGGHVFPCALDLGIFCAARPRPDRRLRLLSLNVPEAGVLEYDLDALAPKPSLWTAYPLGVIRAFDDAGYSLPCGLELAFFGNLPLSAGLSSSAAMEVLTGLMLKSIFSFASLTLQELALLGQAAENRYVGVTCGIMDQFASAMGRRGHAIFLDTATLAHQYAPLALEDACLVITNSQVRHSLAGSAYNERRAECEQALHDLQRVASVRTLGELSPERFAQLQDAISSPVCRCRARHAVLENNRTVLAYDALREGRLDLFGQLMNESHLSLRDNFEVSCPELDLLAELAWSVPGVIGSRMTGGGFGGCTVSIVKKNAMDSFRNALSSGYRRQTGLEPLFYIAAPGPGAHELTM